MNSDSRQDSLDEQDNTNEPPETSAADGEAKESEDKTSDNSGEASTESGSGVVKDEDVSPAGALKSQKDEDGISESEKKETKPVLSDESDGKIKSETDVEPKVDSDASAKQDDSKPDKSNAVVAATTGSPTAATKEQEIISTVANIKKESNASSTPSTASDHNKDAVFIKKEPRDESAENVSVNEPHDLKLVKDIKAESNRGLDLTDHEHKQEAQSKTPFDAQQKFGNGPSPSDAQATKTSPDVSTKQSSPSANAESGLRSEASGKPYGDGEAGVPSMKYAGVDATTSGNKHGPAATSAEQQMKYESNEGPLAKRPAYAEPMPALRSPYETTAMMKYNEVLLKYPGVPPPPIPPPAAQDLKYVSPAEMKYRTPENLSKSQFGADHALKANSIYGEYGAAAPPGPPSGKYPPTESPIDASSRSTPNQDSQGSNSSNLPPQMPSGKSSTIKVFVSVSNSQFVSFIAGAVPMLMGPGGIPAHHLPPGHSPLHAPPQQPPSTSTPMSIMTSMHHMVPTTTMAPSIQVQPLSLLGAPHPNQIMPPSSGLHRPHPDLSHPSLHHAGAFGPGILPPPPPHSLSNQSQSPALNSVSRAEHEQQRRMESMHHRASPSLLPPGATMLGHPSIPLHLQAGMSAAGLPMLPPHHPAHLGPPLLPPSMHGALMGGPAPPLDGRRTPTSVSTASSTSAPPGQANVSHTSSAFSRTSPSVQFSHPSAHRSASPSQPPSNLTRGSPLHLSHHSSSSALSAAAAAAAERDRQALLRQQSPHMTPPPPTSAASILSSPLNSVKPWMSLGSGPPPPDPSNSPMSKPPTSSASNVATSQANAPSTIQQSHTPQPRSMAASPPHHLRPGTSPPVIRHPHALALPLIGQPGPMPSPMSMHPHNPYSHHLIHPMFAYTHQHNPFNSPYPYHPYSPGFQYMKPPSAAGMEPGVMPQHHPGQVPSRCEEPHPGDKNAPSSMQHKIKPPTPKTPQGSGGSAPSTPAFASPHAQYASPHAYGDSKTSHMDALRAHAHSASGAHGGHHSAESMHVEIEPDPEPEIPSPTHNIPRGPSPEAKLDDTECHRSQSAM